MLFMAGLLKMVLQLLFGVATAFTHGAHLLRRWCTGMGVLVRAGIPQIPVFIFAHTGIVPLDLGIGQGEFCALDRPLGKSQE